MTLHQIHKAMEWQLGLGGEAWKQHYEALVEITKPLI